MKNEKYAPAILEFIDRKSADLLDFASKLVKTNSVNPPGDERAIADIVSEELASLGLDSKILNHGDHYRSVISTVGTDDSRPGIMLNGHLDTVPPGEIEWAKNPFSGELDGGFLYGRGASDMKAGDAAIIYAAAAVASSGIKQIGLLKLALSSSEETISKGAKAIASSDFAKNIGSVLIAEPTDLEIYTAEKGCFWITVTARGKTAHGSMPQCGVNAIEGLIDFLSILRSRWSGERQSHPKLGQSTASVDIITGGVGTNVVPDLAKANVDIRTIPGQDHERLLHEMNAWANKLEKERPGLKIFIEVINDRPPYEIPEDHPVVRSMEKQAKALLGRTVDKKAVSFYTDASVFGPICGFPVIIFGPGNPSMAHQPDEKSETSSIVEAAKIIALWAADQLS